MRVLTTNALPSQMAWTLRNVEQRAHQQRATEQRKARRLAAGLILLTIAGTALGVWA